MSHGLVIDRDRGIPSNQVHAIGCDAANRLWFAGPAGLARYDGSRVRAFDRRDGLACAGLRAVAVGARNTVWIGTDLGLEAVTEDGTPISWESRLLWIYGLVQHVLPCDDGAWLGTARGLVRILDDRGAGTLKLGFHDDLGFVRDVIRLDDNSVLAVSARLGLVEFDGAGTRRFRNLDLPEGSGLTCAKLSTRGDLLVGSVAGLWILDREGATAGRLTPETGPGDVTALAVDGDRWWVGFGRFVDEYEARPGASPRHCTRREFASRVNDILVDRVGNVWVATDNSGVDRISCVRDAIHPIDTQHRGAVYSIKQEDADSLRIGGEGFDARLTVTAPRSTEATLLSAMPTTVWDSATDPCDGGSWLATQDGLFRVNSDGTPSPFRSDEPLLSAPCRTVLWRGNSFWVGTLRGLARVCDGSVEEICTVDGQSFGYVYAFWIDGNAKLWVGTLGRGLWREGDAGFEPVGNEWLTPTGNTYVVTGSPDGNQILVIQDERVVLLGPEDRPRLLSTDHPVAGWTAIWLDDATIAIGSSDGLRLINAGSGEVERRISVLLDAGAWEFTNNRALIRARDGRVFCGLNAGLYAIDLDEIRKFTAPPRPSLGSVVWRGASPVPIPGGFAVRPGKWSLQVQAFSAWFVDERQVQFRFRLVGFEEDWSMLGPRAEARYSSLPPGEYTLEAQAYAPLTGLSAPATLLRIEVATHPLSTGLAVLLGGLSAAYDRVVGSRMRNRSLIEQSSVLEAKIAERTRQLERTNTELRILSEKLAVSALTDVLTGVANRRHFDATLEKETERALRSSQPVAVVMIDIDHFKRYNDHYGHQAGDGCLRAVARAIEAGLREYDFAARYGGEEFAVILPSTGREDATIVGERLCSAVRALALEHAASPSGSVTISLGAASSVDVEERVSPGTLLRAADKALYKAKEQGRNRLVVHGANGARA